MDALIWILLPMITAIGSALLAFYIMQARLEVVVAKEREALVEARTQLKNNERQLEDRVKVAEEATRRQSFDDFLGDIRVEERHYMRENKSLFTNTKSMVLQERLYFRNLPLSNWIEHELTVEQGQTADMANLARAASVFSSQTGGMNGAIAAAAVSAQSEELAQVEETNALAQLAQGVGAAGKGPSPFGASPSRAGFGRGNRNSLTTQRNSSATISKVASIVTDDREVTAAGPLNLPSRFSQSRLVRG